MKKLSSIFLSALLLLLSIFPSTAHAAALPSLRITAPSVVQAEVGEEFVISIALATQAQEVIVGGIYPTVDNHRIRIGERTINQILPANTSVNVNLTGTAQAVGLYRVMLDVAADGIILSTEVMVDVKDPDEAAKRPRLSVTDVTLLPAAPSEDTPFTVTMTLKNTGEEATDRVFATLVAGANFSVESITNRLELPSIDVGDTAEVSFRLKSRENRQSNEVTLNLVYGTFTQAESVFLPVPELEDAKALSPPVLKISSFNLIPAEDGRFNLVLDVLNEGGSAARDIRISVDGGNTAFPAAGGNVRTIKELGSSRSAKIEYLLRTRGALTGHPINVSFEFTDEDDVVRRSTDIVFVTTDNEPKLRLRSFRAAKGDTEGDFTLVLEVQNTGLTAATDVEVRFAGSQAAPKATGAVLPMQDIAPNGTATMRVPMRTSLTAEAYSIPFEISFTSVGGAVHTLSETVVVSAETIGVETDPDAVGMTAIVIESQAISGGVAVAGETFTLSLTIKNTTDENIGRIRLTFGDARSGASEGSVFATVDGTQSFFAESLPASENMVLSFELRADRDAQAMTYTLPLTIEFEDADGAASTVNAVAVIPVRQEGRLRILTFDIPSDAKAGEALPVSMEFANTGRVNIENMFISLEGDFEKENATFFIPSFNFGTSDFFNASIFPESEGVLSGTIVITYDDGNGGEVRLENPFTVNVAPAAIIAGENAATEGPFGRLTLDMNTIILLAIALLVVMGAAFAVVKKIRSGKAK